MSTTVEYPHLTIGNDGRTRHIVGAPRVRVLQIAMDHVGRAWPAEEIARQYPHLSLAAIHSALAYYYDHREEMDREILIEAREAAEQAVSARQAPRAARLAALARE